MKQLLNRMFGFKPEYVRSPALTQLVTNGSPVLWAGADGSALTTGVGVEPNGVLGVNVSGVYRFDWIVNTSEPSQFSISVNGVNESAFDAEDSNYGHKLLNLVAGDDVRIINTTGITINLIPQVGTNVNNAASVMVQRVG